MPKGPRVELILGESFAELVRICKVYAVPEILINILLDHTASHPRRRWSSDPAARMEPMGQRDPKRREHNIFYEFYRTGFISSEKRQFAGSMLLK
jgi:hypothetical protein